MVSGLLALSLFQGAAAAPPAQDDYVDTWNKVERLISNNFYAKVERADELKRRLDEAAPKAKAAKSRQEFHDVVVNMADGFRDSHFDYLTTSQQGYYLFDSMAGGKEALPNIGAWFRSTKDGYTVQMVVEGSEAAKQGLRKGDLILKANGQPFGPVDSFRTTSPVSLEYKRAGKVMQMTVQSKESPGIQMFVDGSRASGRVIEQGGKRIGYFHLWCMVNDDFRQALADALSRMLNTDAFILDLRDGFGGRPERFLDRFYLPGTVLDWKVGNAKMHEVIGYDKPLVVLINEGSRSAKEVASEIIKSTKRGTLVGHPTAGHVLGTTPMRVNAWSYIEIPIATLLVNGTSLEDNPVQPDVMVGQEISEDGTDMILKKGLEVVMSKLR